LTLSINGKISLANEEASKLLKIDVLDMPTLEALGQSLRRLNRNIESGEIYERGYSMTSNEDFGIESFYSYIKALAFRRCHQVCYNFY
jgi:hypothetical protein